MLRHANATSAFRTVAHAVHTQLIQDLRTLTQRARATERGRSAWQALEAALLAHLRLESELLLPDLDLVRGNEASRIREEHERIRQLVVHLNQDSSTVDAEALTGLCDRVEDCVALEERMLYPWADLYLPQRKRAEFIRRSPQSAGAGAASTSGHDPR